MGITHLLLFLLSTRATESENRLLLNDFAQQNRLFLFARAGFLFLRLSDLFVLAPTPEFPQTENGETTSEFLAARGLTLRVVTEYENPAKQRLFNSAFRELSGQAIPLIINGSWVEYSGFIFTWPFEDIARNSGLILRLQLTCSDCVFVSDLFGTEKELPSLTIMLASTGRRNSRLFFWVDEVFEEMTTF